VDDDPVGEEVVSPFDGQVIHVRTGTSVETIEQSGETGSLSLDQVRTCRPDGAEIPDPDGAGEPPGDRRLVDAHLLRDAPERYGVLIESPPELVPRPGARVRFHEISGRGLRAFRVGRTEFVADPLPEHPSLVVEPVRFDCPD